MSDAHKPRDAPIQAKLDEVARCGIHGQYTTLTLDGLLVLVVGAVGGVVMGLGMTAIADYPDPLRWLLTQHIAREEFAQAAIWCVGYGGLAVWLARKVRRDPINAVQQRVALGVLSRLAPYDAGGPASVQHVFMVEDAPDARDRDTVVSVFAPCAVHVRCTTHHGALNVTTTVYGYMGETSGPAPGALIVVERDTHPWFELTARPSQTPGLEPEEAWKRGLDEAIEQLERELDARLPSSPTRPGLRMVRGGAQAPLDAPKPRAWALRGSKRPIAHPRPPTARLIALERAAWAAGVLVLTALLGAALLGALGLAADPSSTFKERTFLGLMTLGVAPVLWAGAAALYKSLPAETITPLNPTLAAPADARLELGKAGRLTLTSGDDAPMTVDLTRPFVVRLHHEREAWMHVVIVQGTQRLTVSAPCAGFADEPLPSALEMEAPVIDDDGLRELWSALVCYGALSEGDRGDLSQWRPEGAPSKHAQEVAAASAVATGALHETR